MQRTAQELIFFCGVAISVALHKCQNLQKAGLSLYQAKTRYINLLCIALCSLLNEL